MVKWIVQRIPQFITGTEHCAESIAVLNIQNILVGYEIGVKWNNKHNTHYVV